MYYPKQKLIFVHIPKTGGSTLEYHLGEIEHPKLFNKLKNRDKMRFLIPLYKKYKLEPEGVRHNIHRRVKAYNDIGKGEDGWRIISLLRNPFSQIKSLYTMSSEDAAKRGKGYPTWEDHIMREVNRPQYIQGQRMWLDYYYILGAEDKLSRSIELFPFEHYVDAVMPYLADDLDFKFDPEVKMWATKPKYEYTPEMIDRVLSLYGGSYELWREVKDWWEEEYVPYIVMF